jgi:hypothetical protein
MRTNIDLDENLIREAKRYSSARTKRGIVEEALRAFVDMKTREQQWKKWDKQYQKIIKKTANLHFEESAADLIRADRDRDD